MRKRNKKGSIQDIVFIAAVLLFFGVIALFGFKITKEINTHIQPRDDIPDNAKTAGTQLEGFFPGSLDNAALFLLIGLCIVAIILAALVKVHPIFIPLFIIALIFIIFLCGILSNVYQEMAANPNLSDEAEELTFINNILEYLPMFVAVFGILLMIILYKVGDIVG